MITQQQNRDDDKRLELKTLYKKKNIVENIEKGKLRGAGYTVRY